jgi:hypothetical protein
MDPRTKDYRPKVSARRAPAVLEIGSGSTAEGSENGHLRMNNLLDDHPIVFMLAGDRG